MSKSFASATALALSLLASSVASAAEKTVTLAVENMYCATSPHTVRASLEAVPDVVKVAVSFKEKTAIVTLTTTRPM
ncbi:heavy metal-associated domain-containing protein [Bradyrhizobium sp. NAS80.1]|uniref:heavy-metal-associated domain-containing protein n=1 Tax=Bradyrhizobium sp. NAS80.1 TaxID=1680159 RepID=UPI001FD99A12